MDCRRLLARSLAAFGGTAETDPDSRLIAKVIPERNRLERWFRAPHYRLELEKQAPARLDVAALEARQCQLERQIASLGRFQRLAWGSVLAALLVIPADGPTALGLVLTCLAAGGITYGQQQRCDRQLTRLVVARMQQQSVEPAGARQQPIRVAIKGSEGQDKVTVARAVTEQLPGAELKGSGNVSLQTLDAPALSLAVELAGGRTWHRLGCCPF